MGSIGPEQPLLFVLDGLDMRWRSLATVAEQVEGGRRALDALGLPAGAIVAFTWRAGPDAVAADLAIRAGGWTSLALTGTPAERSSEVPAGNSASEPLGEPAASSSSVPASERAAPPPAAARLLLPGEPEPPGDSAPVARLPSAETELSGRRDRGILDVPLPDPRRLPGGALVRLATGSGETAWRTLTAEEVAKRADRLESALSESSGGRRPIVVACLDASTPDGRVVLDWALAAEAALYLEPDGWALGGIAAWCRPTMVAGDGRGMASVAAEIRRRERRPPRVWSWIKALARRLGGPGQTSRPSRSSRSSRPSRPPRPPFGRLRAAVLLRDAASGSAGARLSADDLALFGHHGVALVTQETPERPETPKARNTPES